MKVLKAALLFFFCFSSFIVSQDSPSLADIARRARSETNKASGTPVSNAAQSNTAAGSQTSAPTGSNKAAESEQEKIARLSAEANLNTTNRYEDQVRSLFYTEEFDKIEQMADAARTSKTHMLGGPWAIHLLYQALMTPAHGDFESSESEWKIQLDRLQRWANLRPKSVTARIALAGAYESYAWKARGNGYANDVTDEGWKVFNERSQKALQILIDAFNLSTKDPEWFYTMQSVMRAQGMEKAQLTAIFDKAIAFEPDYQYYYRAQAENLLPQWYGEEGEMALFAEKAADRIGGAKGDALYYQIAIYVDCFCDDINPPKGMSWARIKKGYLALEDQYGVSLDNANMMAKFAGAAGDPDFAHELFSRIGEAWAPGVWKKRENFEMVRNWAGSSFQIRHTIEEGTQAAEKNMKTQDGRAFGEVMNKTFQSDYSKILDACMTLVREKTLTPFDLVLQVGKNGTIEQSFSNPLTQVALCVQSNVARGHFPSPPAPSYWVKINVQGPLTGSR